MLAIICGGAQRSDQDCDCVGMFAPAQTSGCAPPGVRGAVALVITRRRASRPAGPAVTRLSPACRIAASLSALHPGVS